MRVDEQKRKRDIVTGAGRKVRGGARADDAETYGYVCVCVCVKEVRTNFLGC